MKPKHKVLAVTRSADVADGMGSLKDVDDLSVDIVSDDLDRIAPTIVNSHAPDILFVEVGKNGRSGLESLATVIRQNNGTLPVIAIGTDASVEDVRNLMRLGVTDYLPAPFSKPDLASALEVAFSKITGNRHDPAEQGQVITFTMGSGGAGATTLAIETAAQLATRTKRVKTPVCVMDLDLQFGNIAWSLDLNPESGVDQIFKAGNRTDDDFIRSVMTSHSSGIDLLAAPKQIVPLDMMTTEAVEQLIRFARRNYAYTIIDTPHVWTQWVMDAFSLSDAVMLVTELNVVAMARTRKQLEFLGRHDFDDLPVKLVLNGYKGGWSARRRRKEAERGLGRKFDFTVGDDREHASLARDRGVLLGETRRRSPVVKGIRNYLNELAPIVRREGSLAF